MPKQATSDSDIERCFDVMHELRTELMRDTFLDTVRAMEQDGYKLAFIEDSIDDTPTVVAAAGYRITTNLFMGKHLYVDDLVTVQKSRSKGYGEHLIKWLREQALNADCNYFHLDSGTHRDQAHKFYFRQGFKIASYHFSERLNDQ
jgi:GNAT superfamily N-acetyltransferase